VQRQRQRQRQRRRVSLRREQQPEHKAVCKIAEESLGKKCKAKYELNNSKKSNQN
jgi:hypothetical protein